MIVDWQKTKQDLLRSVSKIAMKVMIISVIKVIIVIFIRVIIVNMIVVVVLVISHIVDYAKWA
jgi:hypothetical protein